MLHLHQYEDTYQDVVSRAGSRQAQFGRSVRWRETETADDGRAQGTTRCD